MASSDSQAPKSSEDSAELGPRYCHSTPQSETESQKTEESEFEDAASTASSDAQADNRSKELFTNAGTSEDRAKLDSTESKTESQKMEECPPTTITWLLKTWVVDRPDLRSLVTILEQVEPVHLKHTAVVEQLEDVQMLVEQRLQQQQNPLVNAKFDFQLGERLRMLLPSRFAYDGCSIWEGALHYQRASLVSVLLQAMATDACNAVPMVEACARSNVLMPLHLYALAGSQLPGGGKLLVGMVRFVVTLFLSLLDVAEGRVPTATDRDRQRASFATRVIQSGRISSNCDDKERFRAHAETLICMAESKPDHVAAFLESTISKLLQRGW